MRDKARHRTDIDRGRERDTDREIPECKHKSQKKEAINDRFTTCKVGVLLLDGFPYFFKGKFKIRFEDLATMSLLLQASSPELTDDTICS